MAYFPSYRTEHMVPKRGRNAIVARRKLVVAVMISDDECREHSGVVMRAMMNK